MINEQEREWLVINTLPFFMKYGGLMDGRFKNVPLLTVVLAKIVLEQPLFCSPNKQTLTNPPFKQGSLQPKAGNQSPKGAQQRGWLLATSLLDRFRGFADHRVDPRVAHHRLALAHLQRNGRPLLTIRMIHQ